MTELQNNSSEFLPSTHHPKHLSGWTKLPFGLLTNESNERCGGSFMRIIRSKLETQLPRQSDYIRIDFLIATFLSPALLAGA
jgi:hypothetical protein